jgi:hypothetical protein
MYVLVYHTLQITSFASGIPENQWSITKADFQGSFFIFMCASV